MKRIRILCVDDHIILREGISAIVAKEPDMEVVASACSGEQAVEMYQRLAIDVVLMDLRLGTDDRMDGAEAIRQIRASDPGARVIVLTMYRGEEDVNRAMKAGAATYLLKDTLSDKLIEAIRKVHSGQLGPALDATTHSNRRVNEFALTLREEAVVKLIAKGMRNKEIGYALNISGETVQAHLKNIFAKLRVHDRTAALAEAIHRGIVHID